MSRDGTASDFSFKLVLTTLLQRFSRVGSRRVKRRHGRTRSVQAVRAGDVERGAVRPPPRVLVRDGAHTMYPSYDPYYDDEYTDEMAAYRNNSGTTDPVQGATIREICHATSMQDVQAIMDYRICDDWLGGLDAFPGNMYLIAALNYRCPRSVGEVAKKFGQLSVLIIQFFAPPFIFIQYTFGYGLDDQDRIHWDKLTIGLSDWYPSEQYIMTKFVATVFLGCFILNGLFCHMDERNAWLKIDRIINILNHNGRMRDSCDCFLYVGAFMNSWVITWLCVDTFVVLGTADSVTGVLMDALGLAFLYNLDDVASDLRFIDEDDWPGLQLAWVDKHIINVASYYQDIETTESNFFCNLYLTCCAGVLVIFCVVLPLLFVITPFKALHPAPFYESVTQAYLDAHYIKNPQAIGLGATARILMNATLDL